MALKYPFNSVDALASEYEYFCLLEKFDWKDKHNNNYAKKKKEEKKMAF